MWPSQACLEQLQAGVDVHHGDQSAVAIYGKRFQLNLPAEEEDAHHLFCPIAERLLHFRAIYECKLDELLVGCQDYDRVAVNYARYAPSDRFLPQTPGYAAGFSSTRPKAARALNRMSRVMSLVSMGGLQQREFNGYLSF